MLTLPAHAQEIVDNYRTCELTTLSKHGVPVTRPVTALLCDDGRFLLTTSIGLRQKAFNIRRNPRVSLLFSEPRASSVAQPGALLVRGDATAEDRIVSSWVGIRGDARVLHFALASCVESPASREALGAEPPHATRANSANMVL